MRLPPQAVSTVKGHHKGLTCESTLVSFEMRLPPQAKKGKEKEAKAAAKRKESEEEEAEDGDGVEKDPSDDATPAATADEVEVVEAIKIISDAETSESAEEVKFSKIGNPQFLEAFKLGHVIGTAIHTPFYIDEKTPAKLQQSDIIAQTKFGPIISKNRKFMVIARYPDHIVTLPIYTHNGRGLQDKSNKKDYIGIRDSEFFADTKDESPNGPCVIVTRIRKRQLRFDHPGVTDRNSYLHITGPGDNANQTHMIIVCFKYGIRCIIESRTTEADFKRVIALYNANPLRSDAPRPIPPPKPQVRPAKPAKPGYQAPRVPQP
ncbi:hypothetical protein VTL71DRAFT_6169 [Oculimacula yallundae]|uniref:DUF6590 domain-containing protein n=1 Tax=Oculimacula yallundae TaxID=86028 RepID=A0ABR4BZP1_9HELO